MKRDAYSMQKKNREIFICKKNKKKSIYKYLYRNNIAYVRAVKMKLIRKYHFVCVCVRVCFFIYIFIAYPIRYYNRAIARERVAWFLVVFWNDFSCVFAIGPKKKPQLAIKVYIYTHIIIFILFSRGIFKCIPFKRGFCEYVTVDQWLHYCKLRATTDFIFKFGFEVFSFTSILWLDLIEFRGNHLRCNHDFSRKSA